MSDLYFRIVECGGSGFRKTPWYKALNEAQPGHVIGVGFGNRTMGKDLYFATMLEF